jgi:hypothetical protein
VIIAAGGGGGGGSSDRFTAGKGGNGGGSIGQNGELSADSQPGGEGASQVSFQCF